MYIFVHLSQYFIMLCCILTVFIMLCCILTVFMLTFDKIYRNCIPLQLALSEDGLYGPKHVAGILRNSEQLFLITCSVYLEQMLHKNRSFYFCFRFFFNQLVDSCDNHYDVFCAHSFFPKWSYVTGYAHLKVRRFTFTVFHMEAISYDRTNTLSLTL